MFGPATGLIKEHGFLPFDLVMLAMTARAVRRAWTTGSGPPAWLDPDRWCMTDSCSLPIRVRRVAPGRPR